MLKEDWDKDFDTLLRATAHEAASANTRETLSAGHLDADALNLFTENILPLITREKYTAHLAECDLCRRNLRQLVLLNEASETSAEEVRQAVEMPTGIGFGERLRRFFTVPVFGALFGALALAIVGAFVFISNSRQNMTSETAQTQQPSPFPSSTPSVQNSSPNAATSSDIELNEPVQTANSATDISKSNSSGASVNSAAKTESNNRQAANRANNTANAPNAPISNVSQPNSAVSGKPAELVQNNISAEQHAADKADTAPPASTAMASKRVAEETIAADLPRPAPKALPTKTQSANEDSADDSVSAETNKQKRASKSVSSQDAADKGAVFERNTSSATRRSSIAAERQKVSGKVFEKRQGIWTDVVYQGQATKNVRRNSDEFQKLDKGLRKIAAALGSAVVVWHGTAYRIE